MKLSKPNLKLIIFLPLAFLATTTTTAFSGTDLFRYSIQMYPAVNRSCDEIGQNIADRFTNITQQIVESWTCRASRPGTFDLTLFYLANERLRLESTWHAKLTPEGTYQTSKQCWEDREAKIQQFREVTGLEPVVAYCFQEAYPNTSDHSYVLRIDAFGEGSNRHFSHDIPLGEALQRPSIGFLTEFLKGIEDGLSSAGADVFAVFIRNDPFGIAKVSLNYYNDAPVDLRFSGAGLFGDYDTCETQRRSAVTSSASVGQKILASSCVKLGFATWQLTLVHFPTPEVRPEEFPTIYSDLLTCQQQIHHVIKDAQERYGWKVQTGFCTGSEQEWRISAYRNLSAYK